MQIRGGITYLLKTGAVSKRYRVHTGLCRQRFVVQPFNHLPHESANFFVPQPQYVCKHEGLSTFLGLDADERGSAGIDARLLHDQIISHTANLPDQSLLKGNVRRGWDRGEVRPYGIVEMVKADFLKLHHRGRCDRLAHRRHVKCRISAHRNSILEVRQTITGGQKSPVSALASQ
jgi:hypothetical protein